MNRYKRLKTIYRKKKDDIPVLFVLKDEQLKEKIKESGLKGFYDVASCGNGKCIRMEDLFYFTMICLEENDKHHQYIMEDRTGEGYIKDMFICELENHNYANTNDLKDTLNALNLTQKQIDESPTLRHGLELAKKEVLQKVSEEDYEL